MAGLGRGALNHDGSLRSHSHRAALAGPLDGGRVAVGLLPKPLALPLARLEPFGMLILIGFLILLPLAGSQFGLNLNVISAILRTTTGYVIQLILTVTGNT